MVIVRVASARSVQVDESTGQVSQLTFGRPDGGVQVQPYAAPRSGGLWDDIRGQIRSSINSSGGLVEEAVGFGQGFDQFIRRFRCRMDELSHLLQEASLVFLLGKARRMGVGHCLGVQDVR